MHVSCGVKFVVTYSSLLRNDGRNGDSPTGKGLDAFVLGKGTMPQREDDVTSGIPPEPSRSRKALIHVIVVVVVFFLGMGAACGGEGEVYSGDERVRVRLLLEAKMPDGKFKRVSGAVHYSNAPYEPRSNGTVQVDRKPTLVGDLPPGDYELVYCPGFDPQAQYGYEGRVRLSLTESKTYVMRVKPVKRVKVTVRVSDAGFRRSLAAGAPVSVAQVNRCCEGYRIREVKVTEDGTFAVGVLPETPYRLRVMRPRDEVRLVSDKIYLYHYREKEYTWRVPYTGGPCVLLHFMSGPDRGGGHFPKFESLELHSGGRVYGPYEVGTDGKVDIGVGTGKRDIPAGREYRIVPKLQENRAQEGAYHLRSNRPLVVPGEVRRPVLCSRTVYARENLVVLPVGAVDADTGEAIPSVVVVVRDLESREQVLDVALHGSDKEIELLRGTYTVHVRAEGFQKHETRWDVGEDFCPQTFRLEKMPRVKCEALDHQGKLTPALFRVVYRDASEGDEIFAENGRGYLEYEPGRRALVVCEFQEATGPDRADEEAPGGSAQGVSSQFLGIDSEAEITFRQIPAVRMKLNLNWPSKVADYVRQHGGRLLLIRAEAAVPSLIRDLNEPPKDVQVALSPGSYRAFIALSGQAYHIRRFDVSRSVTPSVVLMVGKAEPVGSMQSLLAARIEGAFAVQKSPRDQEKTTKAVSPTKVTPATPTWKHYFVVVVVGLGLAVGIGVILAEYEKE